MTPEERAKEVLPRVLSAYELEWSERFIAEVIRAAVTEEREACAALFRDMLILHLHSSEGPEAEAAADRLDAHHPLRADLAKEISIGLYRVADAEREACARGNS